MERDIEYDYERETLSDSSMERIKRKKEHDNLKILAEASLAQQRNQ